MQNEGIPDASDEVVCGIRGGKGWNILMQKIYYQLIY